MFRYRVLNLIYKWLPVVCGCHCRDDRCFHFRGIRHPVCARCEGILAGALAAACAGPFWHPDVFVLWLMLLPLIVDGGVQRCTAYQSTNPRRFLTGLLFGYGGGLLLALSIAATFRYGYGIGAGLL